MEIAECTTVQIVARYYPTNVLKLTKRSQAREVNAKARNSPEHAHFNQVRVPVAKTVRRGDSVEALKRQEMPATRSSRNQNKEGGDRTSANPVGRGKPRGKGGNKSEREEVVVEAEPPQKKGKASKSVQAKDGKPADGDGGGGGGGATPQAASVTAALRYTFDESIAFEPWKGKNKKYRFMGAGMSTCLRELTVALGDLEKGAVRFNLCVVCSAVLTTRLVLPGTVWTSNSPQFRLECNRQPLPALVIEVPADVVASHRAGSSTDLRSNLDTKVKFDDSNMLPVAADAHLRDYQAYRLILDGAVTTRAEKGDLLGYQLVVLECKRAGDRPCGRHAMPALTAPMFPDCRLEHQDKDWSWAPVSDSEEIAAVLLPEAEGTSSLAGNVSRESARIRKLRRDRETERQRDRETERQR
eukprot:2149273-Rhodomonas_salina.1